MATGGCEAAPLGRARLVLVKTPSGNPLPRRRGQVKERIVRDIADALATAAVLACYRLGSWVPAPGIDQNAIQQYFNGAGGGILTLLNLFSGSALSRFSLFALGIMPYITASIILQLLTVVIPTLEQLQKEGESGYAKINQYTRYLTVVRAAARRRATALELARPSLTKSEQPT